MQLAVAQDGRALRWASEELRAKRVVSASVVSDTCGNPKIDVFKESTTNPLPSSIRRCVLRSFITHQGPSMHNGHYIADVDSGNGWCPRCGVGARHGSWLMSDSQCTTFRLSLVAKQWRHDPDGRGENKWHKKMLPHPLSLPSSASLRHVLFCVRLSEAKKTKNEKQKQHAKHKHRHRHGGASGCLPAPPRNYTRVDIETERKRRSNTQQRVVRPGTRRRKWGG